MSKAANILVPVELAQALADYLVKQPYSEVQHLVRGLVACPGAKTVEPPKAEPAPAPVA